MKCLHLRMFFLTNLALEERTMQLPITLWIYDSNPSNQVFIQNNAIYAYDV